jgi:hypothetical protein
VCPSGDAALSRNVLMRSGVTPMSSQLLDLAQLSIEALHREDEAPLFI